MQKLRLALYQANSRMGDIAGNAEKLRTQHDWVTAQAADLLIMPELYLLGYPPDDLAQNPLVLSEIDRALKMLAEKTQSACAMLVGAPMPVDGQLMNAMVLLADGKIQQVMGKTDLPNYGVFDDKRVFNPAAQPQAITINNIKAGVLVCEDAWTQKPLASLLAAESGMQFIISANASPFDVDKFAQRLSVANARQREAKLPYVYVSSVGGQDDVIFDGGSFVLNGRGEIAAQLPFWQEYCALVDLDIAVGEITMVNPVSVQEESRESRLYHAMVLATRDYVNKNNFPGAMLGLSGGIDSALVAAIAVDALGAGRVRAFMLPSPYTSQQSHDDATAIARNLGVTLREIPITPGVHVLRESLNLQGGGLVAENLQARLRGLLLMALSNDSNDLLLTTGNKSEMAVGYATLYGDMNGGFNPIKDLYKTDVYRVARWRNEQSPVIPESVLTRAPTAELAPGQTDQDSLPPYDILDRILAALVEGNHDLAAISDIDPALVARVTAMLYRAEYKRRQSAPGPKLTRRAFGRERRYPITNAFRK